MRVALVTILVAVGAGCLPDEGSFCSLEGRVVSLADGEEAPEIPEELYAEHPALRVAIERAEEGRGASVPCPARPMMEDVLALGGTGEIQAENQGFALVSAEGRAIRLFWTAAVS